MDVRLISWTPDPELLAAGAARLCYSDISAVDIIVALSQPEIDHLLDVILSSGHLSVVEHTTFTFAIDGVSRVLTHQLVRHRVGVAYSQQSQRYTPVGTDSWVVPKSLRADPEVQTLLDDASRVYQRLLSAGVPSEDARYILPQAVETRLVMTANLRALIGIYRLDACLRSQWEMRRLVGKMKTEIRKVSPRLARELKIKCFAAGYCDEANMCEELTGRMPRARQLPYLSHEELLTLAVSIGEESNEADPGARQ